MKDNFGRNITNQKTRTKKSALFEKIIIYEILTFRYLCDVIIIRYAPIQFNISA